LYKDLRGYINKLQENQLLLTVSTEVNWKYEIAGWLRKAGDLNSEGKVPAVLFKNIKGYPKDYNLFSLGLGSYGHIALALGLDVATNSKTLINVYKERSKNLLLPKLVPDGPVKENVHTGKDIDLFEFPVPWWTPKDGGRYIGTWHANVTKHPETGQRNVGMYRVEAISNDECAVGFLPFSHMGQHFSAAKKLGRPLEMAIVIGADETINMASATGCAYHIDEFALAGGLRKEAIELVKCETVDLEVPANAEIVIEGIVLTDKLVSEGPFGEHTGYYGGGVRQRPVFKVTGITHRNNPIMRGSLLGRPITEFHILSDIINSAAALTFFEQSGPEDILAVHCPPAADSACLAIIQLKQRYVGQSRNAARMLISSSVSRYLKWVVVVDEDIDPFDLGQVWWALTTRVQGQRDIEVIPFGTCSRSDPSVIHGEFTDKVIVDATKKMDYPYNATWGDFWAPTCLPPKEIMDLVNLKWDDPKDEESQQKIQSIEQKLKDELEPKWLRFREKNYFKGGGMDKC